MRKGLIKAQKIVSNIWERNEQSADVGLQAEWMGSANEMGLLVVLMLKESLCSLTPRPLILLSASPPIQKLFSDVFQTNALFQYNVNQ